jgi:diaminopimelate epimerase
MRNIRYLFMFSWNLYIVAYIVPMLGDFGQSASGAVTRTYIFTIADVLSKIVYGILLGKVATRDRSPRATRSTATSARRDRRHPGPRATPLLVGGSGLYFRAVVDPTALPAHRSGPCVRDRGPLAARPRCGPRPPGGARPGRGRADRARQPAADGPGARGARADRHPLLPLRRRLRALRLHLPRPRGGAARPADRRAARAHHRPGPPDGGRRPAGRARAPARLPGPCRGPPPRRSGTRRPRPSSTGSSRRGARGPHRPSDVAVRARQRAWFRADPRAVAVPTIDDAVARPVCEATRTAGPADADRVPSAGMEFTLAHGTANDFVLLDDLDDRLELSAVLVRALADRRRGLGADGVIRIAPGDGDAEVVMDYRNADGSIVEMCGNGVRVVAKHVLDHASSPPGARTCCGSGPVPGSSPCGSWLATGRPVATVAVDMGPPRARSGRRAVRDRRPHGPTPPPRRRRHGGRAQRGVDGQPPRHHPGRGRRRRPVRTLGPRLEHDPRFPAGANISFAEVVSSDRVRLRVWERGVGETAACGTGACATVVALQRLGLADESTSRSTCRGAAGDRARRRGSVIMTGPAVEVARRPARRRLARRRPDQRHTEEHP